MEKLLNTLLSVVVKSVFVLISITRLVPAGVVVTARKSPLEAETLAGPPIRWFSSDLNGTDSGKNSTGGGEGQRDEKKFLRMLDET